MRNYDRWLEQSFQDMIAAADTEVEAWEAFCAHRNARPVERDDGMVDTILGPRPAPPALPEVPVEACEPDHPDHTIYRAWLTLEAAIDSRWDRLEYEAFEDLEASEQTHKPPRKGK